MRLQAHSAKKTELAKGWMFCFFNLNYFLTALTLITMYIVPVVSSSSSLRTGIQKEQTEAHLVSSVFFHMIKVYTLIFTNYFAINTMRMY